MNKKAVLAFFFVLIALSSSSLWAKGAKVTIDVSLSKNTLVVTKASRLGTATLNGAIIPVVQGSIHTGTFQPTQTFERYWTYNGSTTLQHVIRFGRNGNIRTSRMFKSWQASGTPAAGSIVLDPDLGMLLFDTVRKYGVANTLIRISK